MGDTFSPEDVAGLWAAYCAVRALRIPRPACVAETEAWLFQRASAAEAWEPGAPAVRARHLRLVHPRRRPEDE